MKINTEPNLVSEVQTPLVRPGTYSPVRVHIQESLGTLFLGIISVILLIGWMRAEAHNRALLGQESQ